MKIFSHNGPEPTFADLYRSMSEPELHELLADVYSLVPQAKDALAAEFVTRGLDFTEPLLPPEDTPNEFRELVTIRRYRDLSEAIVARAVIESAGIFCFLKDENLVRLDWQVSNFIGGIRLQVSAPDVESAEAILSQPIPEEISLPGQPDFQQPRCPRCNSTDIAWQRQGRKAALASLYLFAVPLPRGSESWTCSKCDFKWVEDADSEQTPQQR